MIISVIICTHDPQKWILGRTLDALRQQTLPRELWELIIVDSASSPPVADITDLSGMPHARVVVEPELGANAARLCGFRNSVGELKLLVDDDNFLAPDYLENTIKISREWPVLGAFGGNNLGEFEAEPPAWFQGYESILAIRQVNAPMWTNIEGDIGALPFGAGLCVRRNVSEQYVAAVSENPLRRVLGRCGDYNVSGEDPDIASTAFDLGLGVGVFPELQLRHYMPAARLEERAFLRVVLGNSASAVILQHLRKRLNTARFKPSMAVREWVHAMRSHGFRRRFNLARLQGERAAFVTLQAYLRGELQTPAEFRSAFIDRRRALFI